MNYKNNGKNLRNNFKIVSLEDQEIITQYFNKHNFLSCEQNFVNIFSWSKHYPVKWIPSENSDDLLLIYEEEELFMMPNSDITPQKLKNLCNSLGDGKKALNVSNVSENYIDNNSNINDFFHIECNDNFNEYIYNLNDLINLKGKKLRKKKSHIIKFLKNYSKNKIEIKSLISDTTINIEDVKFNCENIKINNEKYGDKTSPINTENCTDCLYFLEKHFSKTGNIEDFTAIKMALNHAKCLKLDGLIVYIDDEVVAFSLFSRQNSEAFTVHFEKINHNFNGASQFLNYSSAIYLKQQYNCELLNREQDLGIEGLRHAKRSYAPCFMLKQYQLKPKFN